MKKFVPASFFIIFAVMLAVYFRPQPRLPDVAPAAGAPVMAVIEREEPKARGMVLSPVAFGPPMAVVAPHLPEPSVPRPAAREGRPKIVIIIDDMGVAEKYSAEVMRLPGPLTLSFLPYAPRVAVQAAEGRAHGDELMIHMPMQPINGKLDMGPIGLRVGMDAATFDAELNRAYASFSGYVGLNNHMGSRLTQDRESMRRVMASLKAHGLYFIDSRTIASSVAADEAEKAGISWASRDVFLDDETGEADVMKELHQVEKVARAHGVGIAIGHPKPGTIAALKEWLPTVKEEGFDLVTASQAVGHGKAVARVSVAGKGEE